MNDIGVYHTALSQFDAAEKVLKRALMMTERSYKINGELQISIITNMAEMFRAKGENETALLCADRVLQLMNEHYNRSNVGGDQIHNQDIFSRSVSSSTQQSTSPNSSSSLPPPSMIYSTQILSSLRKSQVYLILGKVISQCRHLQEGVVYTSMAFEKSLETDHGFSYSPLLLQRGIKDIAIQKLTNNAAHIQTTLDKDYMNLYYKKSPCFNDRISYIGLNTAPSSLIEYLREQQLEKSDDHFDNHNESTKNEISELFDLALKIEGGTKYESKLDVISKTNVAGVVGLALLDINYYYDQHLVAVNMEKEVNSEEREAFRNMLGLTTLDRQH